MATKAEISAKLTELGIEHDTDASKADLEALMPEAAPKTERELRWEAFLVAHEKQNPEKHAARKAAGELDAIPDSFI